MIVPKISGIPGPYHIYFVSFDCNEPPHVHVARERYEAKFWLDPLHVARNYGFSRAELRRIERLLEGHLNQIRRAWDEHCGQI
ncbi:MAG: DUF4160 domain-containing protein [Caldilineae bacterium]|nr:MAG: DUF4160 domain-containing protein [Caldilineae bacterium]